VQFTDSSKMSVRGDVADATERKREGDGPTGGALEAGPRARGPRLLVKWGLRAWWTVGIVVVVAVVWIALSRIRVVVVPLALSLFPAAVLLGPVRRFRQMGAPSGLAAFMAVAAAVGILVAVVAFVSAPLATGLEEVGGQVAGAYDQVRNWLVEGPLGLSEAQLDGVVESVVNGEDSDTASALVGGAFTLVEIVVGVGTTIVALFFVLKDGDRVREALLERLPTGKREAVGRSLRVARETLAYYTGGLALVGLFDAVFIGLGLYLLGVPHVIPVAVIAFLGSFFPLVGAWVGGFIGVAVAYADGGSEKALWALAVITVVEQIEANVVAPVVFRRTLQLHPLVTIVALLAGGAAFGIVGALLAVPLVAVAVAVRLANVPDPDRSYFALAMLR
jgi:putative heme transporter